MKTCKKCGQGNDKYAKECGFCLYPLVISVSTGATWTQIVVPLNDKPSKARSLAMATQLKSEHDVPEGQTYVGMDWHPGEAQLSWRS